MARSSSTEQPWHVTCEWSAAARAQLCAVAAQAIRTAVESGRPPDIDIRAVEPELQRASASFVTLIRHGELRGCIGSLEPCRPLALDVAANACAACCRDLRFPVVQRHELASLHAKVSVLSALMPLPVRSEAQLIELIRPGVDGLVIDDGIRRATFLPAVWSELPDRAQFIAELKRKAGLGAHYWSPETHCFRYAADEFHIDAIQ
jgi:AmmeMemoRadiSam system protein A